MEETYDELKEKNASLELELLKQRVATQVGLPPDLAKRLVGSDEASLTEDAETLSVYLPKKRVLPPLKSTEPSINSNAYSNLVRQIKGE